MKKMIALFLGVMASTGMLMAQDEISGPVVSTAVWFDVSPPLRDMVNMEQGEVDKSWKDGVVKNNIYPYGYPVGGEPDGTDPVLQSWFGSWPADTTIANFAGISGNGSLVPPDTDGDVGPNHYFQVVNSKYQIFNKNGVSQLGPVNNNSIWSGFPHPGSSTNDGDGIVLYDEEADRWLFSQFALPSYPNGPFYEMVAISQTGDPTGSWYRYAFQFSDMPDYPKLAVWHDGYYMTINRFASGSMNYAGTGVAAFDRDAMLAGDPNAEMVYFTLSASNAAYSLLPADCDGDFPPAGTPEYVMYLNDQPDRIGIYEFTVDWNNTANSTFLLDGFINVTSFIGSIPGGIPQKNTSVKLDAISGRFMFRLPFKVYSDHWSIAACATVNRGGGIAGVRWWELWKTTGNDWDIYQEGTYSPDDHYRWMGSIAIDDQGNIALGYSVSSSTLFPSIRYTGRLVNDPLGEMTIQEGGIANGGGSQTNTWSGTPSRWGDYSAMAVDPSEEATFWYTQEYYTTMSSASWKTRVGSFSFANIFSVNATATPDAICLGQSSQLNAAATGGSGTYTYSWTSNPAGFTSTSQNPTVTPDESTWYIVQTNDGISTVVDSVKLTVHAMPEVYAGPDTAYNNNVPLFPTFGTASGYATLLWTTSGDGHFNNDTTAACLYYPGSGDIASGSVTLTLTATPLEPCTGSVQDDALIQFGPYIALEEGADQPFALQVMPNPTNGWVTVDMKGLQSHAATLSIASMQGRFIYRSVVEGGQSAASQRIDLSGFPAGIYLVSIESQLGIVVEKLVIE